MAFNLFRNNEKNGHENKKKVSTKRKSFFSFYENRTIFGRDEMLYKNKFQWKLLNMIIVTVIIQLM
jgi:hypothetical protein